MGGSSKGGKPADPEVPGAPSPADGGRRALSWRTRSSITSRSFTIGRDATPLWGWSRPSSLNGRVQEPTRREARSSTPEDPGHTIVACPDSEVTGGAAMHTEAPSYSRFLLPP